MGPIAWSTPLTATSGTALTAAQWNASVRDNLLTTAPALATTAGAIFAATGTNAIAQRTPATAFVLTAGTTTNTSYTATLTGSSSPSVTVTTGPKALVAIAARQSTSSVGVNVWSSVAVSSATTIAASDSWAISYDQTGQLYHGYTYLETSLTPGSNIFTMQHRIQSAGTATMGAMRLSVVAF